MPADATRDQVYEELEDLVRRAECRLEGDLIASLCLGPLIVRSDALTLMMMLDWEEGRDEAAIIACVEDSCCLEE